MPAVIVTPHFIDLEAAPIARALLRHIVEHAEVVGQDRRGRTVLRFELAAEPWLLDKLACLGGRDEDREEDGRGLSPPVRSRSPRRRHRAPVTTTAGSVRL